MIEQRANAQQPHTGAWLLLVVAGFIAIQILNHKPEKEPPGPERGDLVLQRQDLPDDIMGWHCQGFKPALPAEELLDGQFWWTHSWNYRKPQLDAIVAFDQADWKSWHELTVCYQSIEWKLVDREVITISDTVSVVLASLEKPTREKATLVFSLFSHDGSLIPSPLMGMPMVKEKKIAEPFTKKLNNRLDFELPEGAEQSLSSRTFERILQCQVFVPHAKPLSDDEIHDVIELHVETLGYFRKAWLNSQSSLR
jgi:hypothetical protein